MRKDISQSRDAAMASDYCSAAKLGHVVQRANCRLACCKGCRHSRRVGKPPCIDNRQRTLSRPALEAFSPPSASSGKSTTLDWQVYRAELASLPRQTDESTVVDFIIYRARLPSLPRLISQSTVVDFSRPLSGELSLLRQWGRILATHFRHRGNAILDIHKILHRIFQKEH